MCRPVCLVILLAVASANAQELVRRKGERVTAKGAITASKTSVKGSVTFSDLVVKGSYERGPDGRILSYVREVRSREPDHLVQKVELREGGRGYTLRETRPLGSRTMDLNVAPVFLVLDGEWPEGMIPVLLANRSGFLRVLDLERRRADLVRVRPREGGAVYLDLAEGGATLERAPDGTFRRLVVPGEERLVITPVSTGTARVTPVPPGVAETAITLRSGDAELRGLFTRPKAAKAALPGVVLLADAGPRDREGDGAGAGSGILRQLAHELALAGYAAARWDKRGSFASTGSDQGLSGLLQDTRVAAAWLASQPGVDPKRIVLLGHGEGGTVAVQAALERPDLMAGVITLGSPARRLVYTLQSRLRDRLRAEGQPSTSVEEQVAELRHELTALAELPRSEDPGEDRRLLRDLLGVDPTESYQRLKCPLLILYGGDDALVPAGHRALLRSSLSLIEGFRFSFHVIQRADHEFLRNEGEGSAAPGSDRSADLARPRHPSLMLFLRDWLDRRIAGRKKPAGSGR